MAIGDARYAPGESRSKTINEAAKYSSRRRPQGKSTDLDFDAEAKRKFDENYDAIFRKKGSSEPGT